MAVSVLSTPSTASSNAPANPYTDLTHTCPAGSNRLLLLYIGIGDNEASRITDGTPTYGGQSMTRIGSGADDGAWSGADWWYLKESGIAAASNTTISIDTVRGADTFDQIGVMAVCLENVDQTTPVDGVQTSTGNATSGGVTITSATGDMAIAGLSNDAVSVDTSGNQTSLFEVETGPGDSTHTAQRADGAASVSMTWSWAASGAQPFAANGFNVNASGAAERRWLLVHP